MKIAKLFSVVLFSFLTILGITLPSYALPILWTDNQHEYTVVSFPSASWDDAKTDLQTNLNDGWYLATITSQQEQDFVQANILQSLTGFEYWLGGFQSPANETNPNAGWTWVTGETWSYTNWGNPEPNDNFGPGSEQFLAIHTDGSWNDEGNSILTNIAGYIAERPAPVPEPLSLFLLGSGMAVISYRKRLS